MWRDLPCRPSSLLALLALLAALAVACGGGSPAAGPGDASTDAVDAGDGGEAGADLEGPVAGGRLVLPAGHRAELAEGPFLPLTSDGEQLLDAAGRQVILRCLQHHALQDVDYAGREVADGDYARIASWGFTCLRMATSWSRIEPEPGVYDQSYLDEVEAAMDLAHAAGLGVVLEWHQDLWGRCSQSPDSSFAVNANGAPDWTCPDDYTPSALGHWRLFDRLWANEDGLMDVLLAAWAETIARLGEHPALLGYDVLNEPGGTAPSPELELDEVLPGFRRMVPALRAAGARGPLFLDATILRNETFRMATEPIDDLDDELVFAPHMYSGWLRMYVLHQRVPERDKERDFELAVEQAAGLGLPLWNGEWGVNLLLDGALEDLETHVHLEDTHRIGSSYWAFQRAVPGQGDDSISGGQSLLDEDGQVREGVLERLSRPYPIQTPGRLTQLAWDFATHELTLGLTADPALGVPLVLYAPSRQLGERVCLEVSGPDGWTAAEEPAQERVLVQFDAAGDYTVTLVPCAD